MKKSKKVGKSNKFIETIKKKWLVDGTKTFLLVAIIIALFIALNGVMQKLDLTPIDFSQDKRFSITEETKSRISNVNNDVSIYFVGYEESSTILDLAKQYKKANEKITSEAVDINNRPDLAQKYGVQSGTQIIILESGEKSKILTEEDLVTYDSQTYETVDITEEKLTSAILSVTSERIPKIYFLEGYSDFYLEKNMNYLYMYLQNEVNEVESLNLLSTGKIPEDCDTLVITTPNKDFDDIATNAITEYINLGKNILWLNAAQTINKDFNNVNTILAMYGVNPFEVGIIRETDTSKMIVQLPDLIIPEIEYSTITKDLYNSAGVFLVNATKINIDEDKLEEKKVAKTDLMYTSEGAYFRSNFANQQDSLANGEEKKAYLVGAELDKTIKEANEENGETEVVSKLIIFGENYFITDYPIIQNSQYSAIQLAQKNKDLVLNSLAYLVDRPEDITARKTTGTVTYTATQQQDTIIRIVIFAIPLLIILAGIIIWIRRKRRN